ncbi:MAG TPA: right-handed parallel beta-helix repeat-containing protein [Dokdonella sp.]
MFSLVAHAHPALAGAIVVGRGPDCTVATIRAAIERANGFGGYNLILVTDDVANGVHAENLMLQGLRDDLVLELVGGYADCTTLAPTAFGKASLYGGASNRPTVRLRGHVNAAFRRFWMQSGTGEDRFGGGGIDFRGSGTLVLGDVRVAESNSLDSFGAGIHVDGQNGLAVVEFDGGVEVTDQSAAGVSIEGEASLRIKGDGNSIRHNAGAGIFVRAPAFAHVGATGAVIEGNGGTGIVFEGIEARSSAPNLLHSIDAANPLTIAANGHGAVHLYAHGAPGRTDVCLRNVLIEGNGSSFSAPVSAYGRQAYLHFNPENNDTCGFLQDADIACPVSNGCNRIRANHAGPNLPLISAARDASVTLDRMLLDVNQATSILSTNLGSAASTATITMTRSLVLGNTLRDNLFEALDGGIVDIWDSTVSANDGSLSFSLVGADPSLFQVTNSIIDQPQELVYLSNGPIETTHLTRVLARNASGAQGGDEVLVGVPEYRDGYGRLAPGSLGIDYAPAGGGTDFDGYPRDVDTTNVPNQHGPRDLGAFESQATTLEAIFTDGFDPTP